MARNAIVTDLNRCVGCLACTVACKTVNNLAPGHFWIKAMRVGPTLKEGGSWPRDVEMYFLPMQCQHCANPECVTVCPTGASYIADDGSVQINAEACIGCQACVGACPYEVRYLDDEAGTVQKCTMCQERTAEGELPQCVSQCQGRARFFGDLDEGIEAFEGSGEPAAGDLSYEACTTTRITLADCVEPFEDTDVYQMSDQGNAPSLLYIMRGRTWQGDVMMPKGTESHNVANLG